jgi:3',5'-cyclic-AMP phosphodiesterase
MEAAGITRIAHLSDAHVLDPRPSRTRSGWSMRTRFLSFGRPLDGEGRRAKLERSLDTARRAGAQHFVLSGDLTEIGAPGEYETLAEILHDSGIPPERMTLVPGNHDLYSSPDGWRWALEGPLAAFARTSAQQSGKVVDAGGVSLLPVDATFYQPITRSAGYLSEDQLEAIERRAADCAFSRSPLFLVQHHPPFMRKTHAWHWIDGLINAPRIMALLEAFRHLFVLHGHLHAIVDRALSCGVRRIFGATAVVDDKDMPRVRLYDVREGSVEPVHSAVA